MEIDVVFEPICPWSFIGKRRLEQALRKRLDTPRTIRWRPFLLNPAMPVTGMARDEYMIYRFSTLTRAYHVYQTLEETGKSLGIPFRFSAITHIPNTINAHRLVMKGREPDIQERLVEGLFQAYFLEVRDISDKSVLFDIAKDAGMSDRDYHAVWEDHEAVTRILQANAELHDWGISGIPTYIFNQRMVLSGAQSPEAILRLMDAAHEADMLLDTIV